MDINETKLRLVQLILKSEEIEILDQVKQILSPLNEDWWDTISEDEKQAIKKGLEQANRGELVSHDEVKKIISDLF